MSSLVRRLTVFAVCLATGLASVGCTAKPKKKTKVGTHMEEKPAEDTEGGALPTDADIFADEGDDSARGAAKEALGTKKAADEPEADIIETEKIETPKVDAPKAEDIEM